MKFKGCDISEFIRRANGKEVVCWGAGFWLSFLSEKYKSGIENTFSYVVDRDPEKQGTKINICGKELEIKPPNYLFENISDNTIVLITIENWKPLFDALEEKLGQTNINCYAAHLLNGYELDKIAYSAELIPAGWRMNTVQQIPKVIHYIWFGGTPLPDKFKQYIESWQKHCPDYSIVRWDESNYDIDSHPFMRETTAAGRPGLTADYARLDIIYNHGGVYLDVDVELLRDIDELLYCTAFCGFEIHELVALGLGFGAKKNHPMIKAFRDAYDNLELSSMAKKGEYNYIPSPAYQTREMLKHGLRLDGSFQLVNDMAILPPVYLNPLSNNTGRFYGAANSYSIHHFVGSWLTDDELKINVSRKKLIAMVE